jgi:hypothetical protein
MQNSPFGAEGHALFTLHPAIMLVLIPFVVMFVWASIQEYRRWRRFGPSMNKRASYDIDETAPSYEAPPEDKDKAETETTDETDDNGHEQTKRGSHE